MYTLPTTSLMLITYYNQKERKKGEPMVEKRWLG